MKDCCVLCGNETIYDFTDHIDMRYGYVEGVGQFCIECYTKEHPSPLQLIPLKMTRSICIPTDLIHQTPNDMELGGKVRQMYWQESGEQ